MNIDWCFADLQNILLLLEVGNVRTVVIILKIKFGAFIALCAIIICVVIAVAFIKRI